MGQNEDITNETWNLGLDPPLYGSNSLHSYEIPSRLRNVPRAGFEPALIDSKGRHTFDTLPSLTGLYVWYSVLPGPRPPLVNLLD